MMGMILSWHQSEYPKILKILFFSMIGMIWFSPSALALSRQILIEAQVWEISNDKGFDWGVIWDYNQKEGASNADFQLYSSDLRLPIFDESGDPPKGLFANFDVFDLRYGIMSMRIQAALRESRAQILANPKIVVVNGEEATISTGEAVPIVKFAYAADGQQTLNTVFEDTGVKLVVRAAIHNTSDEFVVLDIRPEVKEIARFEKLTSPDGEFELPLLTTRTAQSKVIVRSGKTLIMGGLYQEQTIENVKGVPGLKDIPLAGHLFRSKTQTKQKLDLLIEIRPTILLPGKASFVPAPFSTSSPVILDSSQYQSLRLRPPGQPPSVSMPAPPPKPDKQSTRKPRRNFQRSWQ